MKQRLIYIVFVTGALWFSLICATSLHKGTPDTKMGFNGYDDTIYTSWEQFNVNDSLKFLDANAYAVYKLKNVEFSSLRLTSANDKADGLFLLVQDNFQLDKPYFHHIYNTTKGTVQVFVTIHLVKRSDETLHRTVNKYFKMVHQKN